MVFLEEEITPFGWWIEICTNNPFYLYYFGSFDSREEATLKSHGYVHDLKEEGAEILSLQIELTKPEELTICLSEIQERIRSIAKI